MKSVMEIVAQMRLDHPDISPTAMLLFLVLLSLGGEASQEVIYRDCEAWANRWGVPTWESIERSSGELQARIDAAEELLRRDL